jgi:ABC-type nitrate/sulfonate/bicarbonate transport system substrate-binding protein
MKKLSSAVTAALLLSIALTSPSFADTATTATACAQSPTAPNDLGTLTLASQISQLPTVEWGIQQGCFKKYGITIKTVAVATSQIGMAGLIGGTYDLVVNTPTNLLLANGNGNFSGVFVAPRHGYSAEELDRAKVEPFFPGRLLLQTAMIVGKNSKINTWKDLENKKVALQSFKSADHAGTLLAMKAAGADPKKTEFVTLTSQQMIDAISRGDVDAVVANDPFATQIVQAGGRVIGYPNAYYAEPGVAVAYVSDTDVIAKHVAAMRAFQHATLEINHLLNLKENEATYRKVIAKVTGVTDEAAAKVRLPVLLEKNLTISDLSYMPSKLKKIGFMRGRVNLTPMLFR